MPRPKTSPNSMVVSTDDYAVDITMTRYERMADCLNWLADKFPKRWIKKSEIHRIVSVEARVRSESSQEVRNFWKGSSQAEKILTSKFGRKILRVKGKGIRATVDDNDLSIRAEIDYRRAKSSVKRLKETSDMINPNKISNKAVKAWTERVQSGVSQAEGIFDKLLPPKGETTNNT